MALNNNLFVAKSVKEVMMIAHKDGLLKKIQGGSATDEEKKQLLDLYIDMLEVKPKKAEKAEYFAKTNALLVSAAKIILGKEGALDELKKISDCVAYHSKHK